MCIIFLQSPKKIDERKSLKTEKYNKKNNSTSIGGKVWGFLKGKFSNVKNMFSNFIENVKKKYGNSTNKNVLIYSNMPIQSPSM